MQQHQRVQHPLDNFGAPASGGNQNTAALLQLLIAQQHGSGGEGHHHAVGAPQRGEGFPDILPGDLLVFFEGGYYLNEFCSDANEMDDIFGINYDLVHTSFDFGESKNSKGKGRPVIKGIAIDLDIRGDATLDVKVYRRDQSG